jgi:hypothetical protein
VRTRFSGPARVLAVAQLTNAVGDGAYIVCSVLYFTRMLLRMPVISLAIPLWIVERTHAPTWLVSAVLLLNTLPVMLWQVRTSRAVTDLRGAATLVRRSGVLLLVSCAVFALSAADVPGWARPASCSRRPRCRWSAR